MTRRFIRKVVAPFVAALAIPLAIASHARVERAGKSASGPPVALVPSQSATDAQQLHLLPRGMDLSRASARRLQGEGSASVPMDSGSSIFQPVELYNSSQHINYSSVVIADVNGDGKPDLVVASQNVSSTGDGSVDIFLGNGDGSFQMPMSYDSGGTQAGANPIAAADVNGDGKLDLVVGNELSGTVGVLLGNGDGTFQAVKTFASNGVISVAIADVNGDGKLDLLVANCVGCVLGEIGGGAVGVLLGNGDGTFQPAVTYSSGGENVYSMAVADVNRDGKLDLLLVNWCGDAATCSVGAFGEGSVGVLLGNGDGTFQSAVSYAAGGDAATSIAVADLDGDGKLDLVVGSCGSDGCDSQEGYAVGVLLGNGDGTFRPPMTYAAGSVMSIAVADVNLDGRLDIVAADWRAFPPFGSEQGATVGVLLGNGDGTFQPVVPSDSGAFYSISVAVADLNGDGKPDAVVVNACGGAAIGCVAPGESSIGVLLNDNGSDQIPTSTTMASSLNPSVYGQAVTFTAAVSSASGRPTGTVVFFDGSTELGSARLTNRTASISPALTVGPHSITAAYQGCSAFAPSTTGTLNQVVNAASTTTSVVSSANPVVVGKIVAYSATVTGQYGEPLTGSVKFQDGAATIATVALSHNQAKYHTSYSAAGVHPITATYSGDANDGGSTSSTLTETIRTVRFPSSHTTLATSGSPSLAGQPVTFTATVTSTYGAIPDGELVTFEDDSTAIGTGTTASGVATFTTSSLAAKTHTIKATYAGDSTFKTSSGTVTQVVGKFATTTTVVSSLNPSAYGQAVTWTATVTSTGPNPPTGRVRFAGLGYATLSGGVATFTKTWLNAGTYAIAAEYNGDDDSGPSASPVLNQVVNPASTTTVITSSADPSTVGQNVTFTAILTSSTGAHATGTVTFRADATVLGTVPLEGTVATFSTATLGAASFAITAIYNGATDFTGSSDTLIQSVQP